MTAISVEEKKKALKWQLAGNGLTTIFVATNFYSGSLFIFFLNTLGLDQAKIGLMLSILPLLSIVSLGAAPFVARVGFKRIFLAYTVLRIIFVIMLMFVPLVALRFGASLAFVWVAAATIGFSFVRAVGDTALGPWGQELVPDEVRGKFTAVSSVLQSIASVAMLAIGSYLINSFTGLSPFISLMGIGLVGGLLSTWCYSKMPGGAPVKMVHGDSVHFQHMWHSLIKDRSFRQFCIGIAAVIAGFTFLTTFMALFMRDEIGLPAGKVVWLDISMFIGMTLSSYFWGWAADRYGSKPIMLCGSLIILLFPLICLFLPPHKEISLYIALFAAFMVGVASLAWNLGMGRYLYVTAVPVDKKTAYISIFYVASNIAGALGPITAGWLLANLLITVSHFGPININNYIIIMLIGGVLIILGISILARLPRGDAIPTRHFLRMLCRPDLFFSKIWAIYKLKTIKKDSKESIETNF